jgi:hypothetical protein
VALGLPGSARGAEPENAVSRLPHFQRLTPLKILVRAGDAGPEYLDILNKSASFRIVPFDQRAAVEVAAALREAIDAGYKKGGTQSPWAKVKFDRQIVAIAKLQSPTPAPTRGHRECTHPTPGGGLTERLSGNVSTVQDGYPGGTGIR